VIKIQDDTQAGPYKPKRLVEERAGAESARAWRSAKSGGRMMMARPAAGFEY